MSLLCSLPPGLKEPSSFANASENTGFIPPPLTTLQHITSQRPGVSYRTELPSSKSLTIMPKLEGMPCRRTLWGSDSALPASPVGESRSGEIYCLLFVRGDCENLYFIDVGNDILHFWFWWLIMQSKFYLKILGAQESFGNMENAFPWSHLN